jgi:hypothetical protein
MLTESQRAQLRKMTADEAIEAAYRMGREVALEEAAQICEYWHSDPNAWTAVQIRALKEQS